MKKGILTMLLFGTFAMSGFSDRAKMTIRVIEETGKPILNAEIRIGFYEEGKTNVGCSDTNGLFSASGNPPTGNASFSITKEGYYWHRDEYKFSWTYNPHDKCKPWNPTNTVVLKRIKNPVPMLFAGRLQPELPRTNTFFGFDLERKDWVAPYGKGVHDDFHFQIKRRFVSRSDYDAELTLVITNSLEGIQGFLADTARGSKFYLPYEAPTDEYQTNLVLRLSQGSQPQYLMDQNYIFRVRTKTDENGKIISALYGHIYGPIQFDVINSDTAFIVFTYYLNLDGTPNLEFKQDF